MNTVTLNLEEDFAAVLHSLNQPISQSARELMALELYRCGTISSGKAAQLLEMSRWEFIRYASRLGIAFFDMTEDEWQAERELAAAL